jgi:hypothetical protein
MPYAFGEDDPGWRQGDEDDEAYVYRPPSASQFRYLPPPELGGAPDPVHFSDRIPVAATSYPAQPAPAAQGFGPIAMFFGFRRMAPPPAPRLTSEQQQAERARQGQHAVALVVAALREIGVRRVYCRYDGGEDEGFAWIDHAELRSGERLAPDQLYARLARTRLPRNLIDARLWRRHGWWAATQLGRFADLYFALELAAKLLGGGYGDGPLLLYGAFTVDLDACTITDDRNADPVTRHFTIEA